MDWSIVEHHFGLLVGQAATFDVTLDTAVVDRCLAFARFLVAANETRNLTRLTTPDGLASGMFLDSLLFLHDIGKRPGARIVDVGCGAGFPAVPLALARPDLRFLAIDSRKMKVDFVAEAAVELGLTNLETRHTRAEDLPTGTYDVALARALGDLPTSLSLTLPLVKPVGRVVIARGVKDLEAIIAHARRGTKGTRFDTWRYRLPGYDNDFAHVIVTKSV